MGGAATQTSKAAKKRRLASAGRGFSLVEVVVYVAVLAAISAIAVNTLLRIHAALAEIRVTRTLAAAGGLAMERMVRTIRDAAAVDTAASTLGTSPGVLSLTGSETPALIHRWARDGANALTLDSGAGAVALTPPGVEVSNLIFRFIPAGPSVEAVRVELSVSASSGRRTTTANFFGTAVLRNSYAP